MRHSRNRLHLITRKGDRQRAGLGARVNTRGSGMCRRILFVRGVVWSARGSISLCLPPTHRFTRPKPSCHPKTKRCQATRSPYCPGRFRKLDLSSDRRVNRARGLSISDHNLRLRPPALHSCPSVRIARGYHTTRWCWCLGPMVRDFKSRTITPVDPGQGCAILMRGETWWASLPYAIMS